LGHRPVFCPRRGKGVTNSTRKKVLSNPHFRNGKVGRDGQGGLQVAREGKKRRGAVSEGGVSSSNKKALVDYRDLPGHKSRKNRKTRSHQDEIQFLQSELLSAKLCRKKIWRIRHAERYDRCGGGGRTPIKERGDVAHWKNCEGKGEDWIVGR